MKFTTGSADALGAFKARLAACSLLVMLVVLRHGVKESSMACSTCGYKAGIPLQDQWLRP